GGRRARRRGDARRRRAHARHPRPLARAFPDGPPAVHRDRAVKVRVSRLLEGARFATGRGVIVDVFRAFTTAAFCVAAVAPSDEDEACAEYLASRLAGRSPDVAAAVAKLWEHEDPNWPAWFPRRDAELACEVDRFDFALPVVREDGLLVARPVRMSPATAGGAEPYQPRS